MCGIVAVTNTAGNPVNKLVKAQYFKQKARGSDGFGLFDYQFKNLVREPKEKNIVKWLDKYPSNSIVFHHRFPTSTKNVKSACHPFSTKDFFRTNYILVHNGVIYNDDELKKKHENMGIKYQSEQPDGSFNDSEALLWEVALFLEGKQDKIDTEGAVAFICMALGKGNKHDRIWFARNTNPLNIVTADDGFFLSSEGEGKPIEPKTLYSYDYKNGKWSSKEIELDSWRTTYVPASREYKGGRWEEWKKPFDHADEEHDYTLMGYVQQADGSWEYEGGSPSDENVEDYDYVTPDYFYEPDIKTGKELVRLYKQAEQAKENDRQLIYSRLADKCDGWVYEMQHQLEWEFDCLSLYRKDCESVNTPALAHIDYTLDRYIDVNERLDELWEAKTKQVNVPGQRSLV